MTNLQVTDASTVEQRRAQFFTWPATRKGRYGWGRIAAAFALLFLGVAIVTVLSGVLLAGGSMEPDGPRPAPALGVLQAAVGVALWGLVVLVVARLLFAMRPGDLFSYLPGVRWWLLAQATGVATLAFALMTAVQMAIRGQDVQLTGATLLALVVVVLMIPLQAMAEEMLFRGFAPQVVLGRVGYSTARFWVVSGVLTLVFALVHGTKDVTVFVAVFTLGLILAYLAWRLAGLEGAIGFHVGNNVVASGKSVLVGQDFAAAQSDTTAALGDAALQIAVGVIVALVIVRLARRTVTPS